MIIDVNGRVKKRTSASMDESLIALGNLMNRGYSLISRKLHSEPSTKSVINVKKQDTTPVNCIKADTKNSQNIFIFQKQESV